MMSKIVKILARYLHFAEKSLPLHYKKLRKHIHQFIEHP